ncbi:MAG: type II toxin-antitoxin system VapC family toxin [Acidimicrobiia bacterium]
MKFVDTSFWVALFFTGDSHHSRARRLWAEDSESLLCTNHVLGETWTFLRRRRGFADAVQAVEAIRNSPRVAHVRVERRAEEDAWAWLRRRGDREYSFVDATSFAVMRRRRIRKACAFDGDFTAAGFVEVR